ncbi:MAG: thioredoxin family protein [Litorilituus sp.]|jgi:thiol:disulfide interchange protein|nr:thioredoxin family protein [Litorilituus sp.]
MKPVLIFAISSLLFFVNSAYANTKNSQSSLQSIKAKLPEYSKVYDDKRDPFKDANAALALASATNRNVLIEIGGNWCTWCHKLDAFLLKNPEVYNVLHSQYVLLKVNVSDSNENEDFMKSLPPVLGYPHIYISTGNGKMLLSKDTAQLQHENDYSTEYWLTFLEQWQSKQPSS